MKKCLTVALFYSIVWACQAREASEAFKVTLMDETVKVVSPNSYDPDISVLIENKMSSKIIGKVVKKSGQLVAHVALLENEFRSFPLSMKPDDRIFFVPMAPALQAVELIIGRKAYEIPPKK